MQEFVERLHNSSRRFVPILDPGIPVLPGYRPYDEGIEQDIFIRDITGQPYIGEVRSILISTAVSAVRHLKLCLHGFSMAALHRDCTGHGRVARMSSTDPPSLGCTGQAVWVELMAQTAGDL